MGAATWVCCVTRTWLSAYPEKHLDLSYFYDNKRNIFIDLMSESRFNITPSEGTCFQLADYSLISDAPDTLRKAAERLMAVD
jgi:methionine aminotransferase